MGNLATNVLLRRALEGPQLILSWTNPDDAGLSEVQVRRGTLGFPESITEGVMVYQDTSPTVSEEVVFPDVTVDGQVTYYYTIFTEVTSVWYHDYTVQKREFPLDGRAFHNYLWKQLPSIYRLRDGDTQQLALAQILDDWEGWFNYWEDQDARYGQLYRFLKVYSLEFGNLNELVAYFQEFYEVYTVRDDFLPYIANLIGAKIIGGISLQRQRFLIAEAVALFKIRGTIDGVLRFAEGNFRTTPLIHEFGYDMLESDRLDRTSVSGDAITLNNWDGPWNTIDYVVDGRQGEKWSYRTIGLFFDEVLRTAITPEMLNIAEQFFADYLPGTGAWYAFTHWDSEWFDDFTNPALPSWTKVDAKGYLNAANSLLNWNVPSGEPTSSLATLSRLAEPVDAEFAFQVDAQNVVFAPAGIANSYMQLAVNFTVPVNVRLQLEKTFAGVLQYRAYKVPGFTTIGILVLDESTFTTGGLRIERGPNNLVRWLGKVGDKWELIAEVVDAAYSPVSLASVRLSYFCGASPTAQMNVDSDIIYKWGTNTGWVQVHP